MARPLMGVNLGMGNRSILGRPSPYDRMDRMDRGMGMGGMGLGRGRGNIKGIFDDSFDDFDDFGGPFGGRNKNWGGNMRGGNDRNNTFDDMTGHTVHMRGLPFQCTDEDIVTFFEPFKPCGIFIKMQDDGRASGEADADFSSHEEAQEAMTKDKNTIKHRYIELFLRSSPSNNRRNNFGGGMDDYDEGFGPSYGNRGMGNGYNGSVGEDNITQALGRKLLTSLLEGGMRNFRGNSSGKFGSGGGGGFGGRSPNYTAF